MQAWVTSPALSNPTSLLWFYVYQFGVPQHNILLQPIAASPDCDRLAFFNLIKTRVRVFVESKLHSPGLVRRVIRAIEDDYVLVNQNDAFTYLDPARYLERPAFVQGVCRGHVLSVSSEKLFSANCDNAAACRRRFRNTGPKQNQPTECSN